MANAVIFTGQRYVIACSTCTKCLLPNCAECALEHDLHGGELCKCIHMALYEELLLLRRV